MDVPFWIWALTITVIVAMLLFDFVGHVRTPHAPSLRESALWSAVYVGIAIVFGLLILWFSGGDFAGQYFAGYVTEKSLSVDNLFCSSGSPSPSCCAPCSSSSGPRPSRTSAGSSTSSARS
jgi:tellurite resistance protein TerC